MVVKKVLSIDLDVVMGTCISLYNDLSSSDNDRARTWETIRNMRRIEPHLSYDEENYGILQGFIVKTLMRNQNAKIRLAEDHDNILDFLEGDFERDVKFEITNLDTHHDIDYEYGKEDSSLRQDIVTVGNWVGYLDKYNLLSKYTWINNESSDLFKGSLKCDMSMASLRQFFMLYKMEEYDYIFICLSPGWVPPKYDNLFQNIVELVNAVTDYMHPISTVPYCVKKEPKPLILKGDKNE